MTNGMCSSWISIFGSEDQKHRAKYSLNALRARSRRRARSSSNFSLSLMAVEYAFGRIAARHRLTAACLRLGEARRADRCCSFDTSLGLMFSGIVFQPLQKPVCDQIHQL